MKKIELVYREILKEVIEKKNMQLTQSYLARTLNISLSTVNHSLAPLKRMNAIRIKLRNFVIVDAKKILYYWASIRNIENDIIYRVRINKNITEIEKNMPNDILFGAYSAYKFKFKDVPADYSEVYVYSNNLKELQKRFTGTDNNPNLFVLRKQFAEMTIANIFVDLWNLKEWYAKDFLKALEEKINGILA